MAVNLKLAKAVDQLRSEAIQTLQDVVRIDSTTGKEQECQAYNASRLLYQPLSES